MIQHVYDSHYEGADRARDFIAQWQTLSGHVDQERYRDILARLQYQAAEAVVWRDAICNWIYRLSGIPDDKESRRKISLLCSRFGPTTNGCSRSDRDFVWLKLLTQWISNICLASLAHFGDFR